MVIVMIGWLRGYDVYNNNYWLFDYLEWGILRNMEGISGMKELWRVVLKNK